MLFSGGDKTVQGLVTFSETKEKAFATINEINDHNNKPMRTQSKKRKRLGARTGRTESQLVMFQYHISLQNGKCFLCQITPLQSKINANPL